MPLKPR